MQPPGLPKSGIRPDALCDQRITIINTLIDDYGITANTLGWFYDAMITLVQKEQEMCVEHLINKGFDSFVSPIEGAHESSPFVGAVTLDGFSEKHSISQLRDGVKDRKLNILRLLLTAGLKDIVTLLQSAYKAGFQQAFYLLIARGDANLETIEAIMEQESIESDGIVSCDKIWAIPFKLRQHCTAYCSDIGQKARAFFTKERYFLTFIASVLKLSKNKAMLALKRSTQENESVLKLSKNKAMLALKCSTQKTIDEILGKIDSFLGQCHPIKFHQAKRAFVLATCGSPFLTGFGLKGGCSNESYGNWEMVIEPDWAREAGIWQAMKDDYDSSPPPRTAPSRFNSNKTTGLNKYIICRQRP